MRLPALLLPTVISFIIPFVPAHGAVAPELPCTRLGTTQMADDHATIVSCLFVTGDTTHNNCADATGGCKWKTMYGSTSSGPRCYDIGIRGDGSAIFISAYPTGLTPADVVDVYMNNVITKVPGYPHAVYMAPQVAQGRAVRCKENYFRTTCSGLGTEHDQNVIFWNNACVIPNDRFTNMAISCCKN